MRTLKVLIIPLLLTILLSCDFPATVASPSSLTQTAESASALPGAAPVCDSASDFGKFSEYWPKSFSLQTTSPRFTWFYNFQGFNPGSVEAWDELCVPQTFALYLSTGPDFTDELLFWVTDPALTYDPTKLSLDWIITPPLEPLKTYRWLGFGYYGDINIGTARIAQLHDESKWPPASTLFNLGVFRTGPECLSGAVGVPLLTPFEYGQSESLRPRFVWSDVSCAPIIYKIQYSTSPVFPNIQHVGDFEWSDPGDFTMEIQTDVPFYTPYNDLRDCTLYYWKVRGGIGDTASREYGEWSDVGTVYITHSSCPPYSTPTATSMYQRVTPDTGTYDITPNPPVIVCSNYTDPASCNNHSDVCYWAGKITNPNEGECKTK